MEPDGLLGATLLMPPTVALIHSEAGPGTNAAGLGTLPALLPPPQCGNRGLEEHGDTAKEGGCPGLGQRLVSSTLGMGHLPRCGTLLRHRPHISSPAVQPIASCLTHTSALVF